MAYSARPTSTDSLTKLVNQTAHGFVIGQVLRFDGMNYVLAQADSSTNSQVVGMVSIVPDVNSFYLTQIGYLNNIVQVLVAGTLYYLSLTTAGELSTIKPTATGEAVVPCFIADSASSGYFFANVGDIVDPGGVLSWSVVTLDTIMSVNQGYFTNNAGNVNLTLPALSGVGDTFKAANYGAGIFTITQGAGQSQALLGGPPSTVGAGGSVACTAQYSSITGVCVVANTVWFLMDVVGNYNVV